MERKILHHQVYFLESRFQMPGEFKNVHKTKTPNYSTPRIELVPLQETAIQVLCLSVVPCALRQLCEARESSRLAGPILQNLLVRGLRPRGTTGEAQLMRGIVDLFAQYERAIIRTRTKAALAVKIARGERVGGIGHIVARVRVGGDVSIRAREEACTKSWSKRRPSPYAAPEWRVDLSAHDGTQETLRTHASLGFHES